MNFSSTSPTPSEVESRPIPGLDSPATTTSFSRNDGEHHSVSRVSSTSNSIRSSHTSSEWSGRTDSEELKQQLAPTKEELSFFKKLAEEENTQAEANLKNALQEVTRLLVLKDKPIDSDPRIKPALRKLLDAVTRQNGDKSEVEIRRIADEHFQKLLQDHRKLDKIRWEGWNFAGSAEELNSPEHKEHNRATRKALRENPSFGDVDAETLRASDPTSPDLLNKFLQERESTDGLSPDISY